MSDDRAHKRSEALAVLRAKLEEIDAQTKLPGEPPLRDQVAREARARLSEMNAP